MSAWLVLAGLVAHAKPPPVVTTCPWSGSPGVEDIDPNSVTIGGVKYKVGGGKHLLAFVNLLNVCNAGGATASLSGWQQAQNAVATQAAAITAASISWASKIAQATTDKEKTALGAEAAADAAARLVVLKQLDDAAKVKREEFMFALLSSSTAAAE